MNNEELTQKLCDGILPMFKENYNRGFLDGLKVAENIAGWLTAPNQSKKMAEVEQWAREAIRKAKERINEE